MRKTAKFREEWWERIKRLPKRLRLRCYDQIMAALFDGVPCDDAEVLGVVDISHALQVSEKRRGAVGKRWHRESNFVNTNVYTNAADFVNTNVYTKNDKNNAKSLNVSNDKKTKRVAKRSILYIQKSKLEKEKEKEKENPPYNPSKEKEKEKEREHKKNARARAENVEQVIAYITDFLPKNPQYLQLTEEKIRETANHFFDFFTSNGWKVSGRAAMKDWKAAVRNWLRNSTRFNTPNHKSNGTANTNIDEALAAKRRAMAEAIASYNG